MNAPVVQIQGTGVTGEVGNFSRPKTCPLKDNMVNRPVLGHGGTGATNIFHSGPCSTVRMNRS